MKYLPKSSVDHLISGSRLVFAALAVSLAGLAGCNSGAPPSKTVKGAGTGALVGATAGAVGAAATGKNQAQGLVIGGAAGALVGGVVGIAQEMKERNEQDRIAQERAYAQDIARKRAEEAKLQAELNEELAAAQGFRITNIELEEAQRKAEEANQKLKRLQQERADAIARTKSLQEAHERRLQDEAEAARLEEEIARLKGQIADLSAASGTASTTSSTSATLAIPSEDKSTGPSGID